MAEGTATTAAKTLTIPEETKAKFPDLVEFILGSHSMDDEERQYWVDVLPIMTQDQLTNLREILTNERKQIDQTSKTYTEGMKNAAAKASEAFDEEAYKEKKRLRTEAELEEEHAEKAEEEQVLKQLQNL